MVGIIVCALLRLRYGMLLVVPILLAAALAYVEMRVAVSPFWYGGGVVAHMLRPFAFVNRSLDTETG